MSGPWMGCERDGQLTGFCGFSPKPGEPSCNAEATWHGMVVGPEDAKSMASCDVHLAVMAEIADCVHPHVHPCGVPGAEFCWRENKCFTEWDERAEFAQAAATAGAA